MPRQKGIHKLTGTIGDLTYYESPHGYLVRRTARHDPDKIKNAPNFQGTRNNAEEFGHVAKAAGQLRRLMGSVFQDSGDTSMTSRLMSVLHKVMKEDVLHPSGERRVFHSLQHPAGQRLLYGFELNATKPLSTVYKGDYEADTRTGIIRIPFHKRYLKVPPTAKYVQFTSAWIRPDLEKKKGHVVITRMEPISLTHAQDSLEIIPDKSLPGKTAAILLLHIQFYRKNRDVLEALQENRCGQVVGVG